MKVRRVSLASVALLALAVALAVPVPAPAAPEGQITFAVHVSLAPTWFDPAETPGVITPFMTLYALHDALVKPMPGNPWAPSLAESWTVSKDGLTYEFVLRKGVKFHNGDPADRRGREVLVRALQGRGRHDPEGAGGRGRGRRPAPRALPAEAAVARLHDVLRDAGHRRRLDRPEELHRARRRRRLQEGAGRGRPVPLRVLQPRASSWSLEAYDGYWRKAPAVKRLVFKSVPDESTRLAMLKRAETDVAYSIRGPNAEEVKRTPGLTLKATLPDVHRVARLHRAVGPEVAVGRPPRAARRQPRHRPQGDQRRGVSRLRQAGAEHHSPRLRVLLGARRPIRTIRRGPSSSWPRPGYPKGFDAGRGRDRRRVRPRGRGRHQRLPGRRHPRAAAPAGARGLLQGRPGEDSSSTWSAWAARRPATPRPGSRPS